MGELIRPLQARHALLLAVGSGATALVPELAKSFPAYGITSPGQAQIRVEAQEPIPIAPLVHFFEQRQEPVLEARQLRPSLEDVFVEITGLAAEAMRREKEKASGGGAA